jgi:hypothetical protein
LPNIIGKIKRNGLVYIKRDMAYIKNELIKISNKFIPNNTMNDMISIDVSFIFLMRNSNPAKFNIIKIPVNIVIHNIIFQSHSHSVKFFFRIQTKYGIDVKKPKINKFFFIIPTIISYFFN